MLRTPSRSTSRSPDAWLTSRTWIMRSPSLIDPVTGDVYSSCCAYVHPVSSESFCIAASNSASAVLAPAVRC